MVLEVRIGLGLPPLVPRCCGSAAQLAPQLASRFGVTACRARSWAARCDRSRDLRCGARRGRGGHYQGPRFPLTIEDASCPFEVEPAKKTKRAKKALGLVVVRRRWGSSSSVVGARYIVPQRREPLKSPDRNDKINHRKSVQNGGRAQ